jgi:hypothetical protein
MPCDKIECQLKIECFGAYGKFEYPPCATENTVGTQPTANNTQMGQLCRNCVNLFGCANIHPDTKGCCAFRKAS